MTREDAIRWMTVLKQSKINWIGDTNKIADIKAKCEKAEQEAFDMAIEALSTKSDRPTGAWELDDFIGWKCTNCDRHIVLNINEYGKFCPNCGAKMKNGDSK